MEKLKTKLYSNFKDPSDVYSAITPLFTTCSFFGLAPYTLARHENNKKEFKFQWTALFRNALLLLVLLGSVTYNAIFQRLPFRESNIQQKLRFCQEIFSSLLSCCAIIFACIFAVKICDVFKSIDEVDGAFKSLAVWVPYKGLYMSIMLHLAGIILLTSLLVVNFTFVATPAGVQDDWAEAYRIYIVFMTIFLPYFINLLMELQYCHYLNILRIRYRLLNEYLETLVQETKTSSVGEGWTDIGLALPPPDHRFTAIKSIKKKEFISEAKISKNLMAISDPVYIVDQVAALHIKLTDTAHMINYAFCVQQLLRITVAFVSIVTALFLVAINFSQTTTKKNSEGGGGGGGRSEEDEQLDYFFTTWAFSNACEVMAIVWITSETCEEANTCPRILHKIRNNTNNTNLQDTIEIYSLQMYHNRLYFTVCGLFPLDYTLLYTIVAGVTTYLVILIQFNNADFIKNGANSSLVNSTAAP